MKNYLFLGMMGTALLFSNCSSNDEDNDSAGKLLLSKVTTTYYDNPNEPKPLISIFEYSSTGELIKVWSDGNLSSIEYNNGRPSKINYYNNENKLEYYSNLYYTGNQLSQVKSLYSNTYSNRTLNYTYNSYGQMVSSSLCQSADCTKPNIETYTYKGDNVSSHTIAYTSGINFSIKSEYSYDNKLNPYTNINMYLRIMLGQANTLSKNNYLVNQDSGKSNEEWSLGEATTYTYQYNSSGFPIKAIGKGSDGNISVQYDYEYITL